MRITTTIGKGSLNIVAPERSGYHRRSPTTSNTMPPALKALIAQIAGWLFSLLLVRAGWLAPEMHLVVGVQALGAMAIAALLRSAWWWLPIHLGFSPLMIAADQLGIPPHWYLVAFVALTVVFWTSFRTQVPLYLSNAATIEALLEQLPVDRDIHFLDIGSGTGSVLIALARQRPSCGFTGIETAPGPYLVSRLMARGIPNLSIERGDFFKPSWAGQDIVYAFLSPVPMAAVWAKARRELKPDALLISNSFAIPDVPPDQIITIGDSRDTTLYVYRPGVAAGAKRPN